MQDDYLATDFEKAADKLHLAMNKCGADKCSASLRAELRRDLGVVLVGGQVDRERGFSVWIEALRIDPNVQLDPDVKTKELDQLFEQAKKAAGGAAPSAKPAEPVVPSGDFVHAPPREQAVRTPVPLYAEYNGSEKLVRVIARYKGFGMTEWKTLELRRVDRGWGAVTPCNDVQQGEFQYFLQGFDPQNDPVVSSGDRNNPFRVAIKDELSGEAPHLPGQAPPKPCAEAGDCPPGLPGCGTPRKTGSEDCSRDEDCKSGQCKAGTCAPPEDEAKTFSRLWLGVAGSLDVVLVPSANSVCKLNAAARRPLNNTGYYCAEPDGTDFPKVNDTATNNAIQPDRLNSISGGAAIGNVRVMLSVDYAVTANILIGARLGFVTGTYTGNLAKSLGKTFIPLHLEARGTYVFGKDALATVGLSPIVFAGAGVSEHDASLDVKVAQTGATPETRSVKAWYVGGPGFLMIGAGVRYAVAPRAALSAAAKFTGTLGGASVTPIIAPELAFQFGF